MTSIITLIFFGLGLIIGSFLNVVIFRLNTSRSFGGRSACMSCQKKLCWYELIPVLSFLFLKGRCLRCKTKISAQYPAVEFITGIIFASIYLKLQDALFLTPFAFIAAYAFYAAAFSVLILISVYDIKHKIIPDALALLLGALTLVGIFFFNIDDARLFYPHLPSLWQFLSGFILAAPFALLWLVSSGRWMGLGDAKLAVGLGWLLGPSRLLSGAVLSFWVGAVLGIILVAFSKKYKMKSELPFAPYLVLGSLLAFLFELHIILFNL
jgi:leader peptidase (prepilin peptidase)/N-methyltransferase